ncbi:MAG: methyltransferase domain-containing protein [Chloroflexota bacterium]|nr:MAG: methyltransferase domain-containing protein [Chloroflexota bacterium]
MAISDHVDGVSGRVQVVDHEGRRALMVDGAVVSVAVTGEEPPSGYWAAMLPRISPRNALLLGLGGGTLAHLLNFRWPGIQLTGVDLDTEVIAYAREQFDLDLPNLEVIIADAFDFLAEAPRCYDYVAVDLFRGFDLQRRVLSKPFLSNLRQTIGPHGEAVFNLFQDRRTARNLSRIARVLWICRVDEVGRNVVVHCRGNLGPKSPGTVLAHE